MRGWTATCCFRSVPRCARHSLAHGSTPTRCSSCSVPTRTPRWDAANPCRCDGPRRAAVISAPSCACSSCATRFPPTRWATRSHHSTWRRRSRPGCSNATATVCAQRWICDRSTPAPGRAGCCRTSTGRCVPGAPARIMCSASDTRRCRCCRPCPPIRSARCWTWAPAAACRPYARPISPTLSPPPTSMPGHWFWPPPRPRSTRSRSNCSRGRGSSRWPAVASTGSSRTRRSW